MCCPSGSKGAARFMQKPIAEKMKNCVTAEEYRHRNEAYKSLCNYVNQEYLKLEKENAEASNGKVYLRGFPACKEINLWTYWQGYNSMAPKILILGQDFGCPFSGAFGEESDVIEAIRKTEQDGALHYFEVFGSKKKSVTDVNLAELLKSLDQGYDDVINQRYEDLFFSNVCLGYRSNKNSGGFQKSWITQIERDAYPELLRILKPSVIVCLGKHTYDAFLEIMSAEDSRNRTDFNKFIDKNCKKPFRVNGIPVFAVAHCGAMGTLNRNRSKCKKHEKVTASLNVQIEDWSYMKKYL